ncbi:MAG TPA: alpha/beta hydrolase [Thermoanaerobaculia bacterium]|nr:alpha/beta hydrolase [Thermoanaerobaculia bacterium]
MWPLLRLVVIALVVLFAFAQYIRRTGIFFPERYPLGDWNQPGAVDVHFKTDDGVTLHGWLFRAPDAAAPLLVWCHGNGGNITGRAPIAAQLAKRGVTVLLFDWRGYGKSEGSPSESKLYRDALAAYDYAARELHPAAIVLYGESLGGPYAAYVASRRKTGGVVIENSLPSLRELGNTLYRPLPLGWFAPFAMTTTKWLNEANVPVLVMHGTHDQVIPFALGRRLYDGLHVPRKQLLISIDAGHGEIAFRDPRYYDEVVRFVLAAKPRDMKAR